MKNLICFVIIMLVSLSVFAATLVVNQFNGHYYTINDAYNDAVDHDTILIYPATYLESVSILKPITLKGLDPNSTKIKSNSTTVTINSDSVFIEGVCIKGVSIGLRINTSTAYINNCIFEDSAKGIYVDEKSSEINNCIFRNCNDGVNFRLNSNGIFSNNIIDNCSENGIYLATVCCATRTIDVDFYNNIITNCDVAIRSYYINCTGYINYNCFYGNSNITSGSGITLDPENIFEDPLLFDIQASNFYLQSSSPCIDTGNPNVQYNDYDGTRNDMGIFGGPQQWGSGNPTVLDILITPESVYPGETFDIEATGQIK